MSYQTNNNQGGESGTLHPFLFYCLYSVSAYVEEIG